MKQILFALFLTTVLLSCSKKKDSTSTTSRYDLLVNKKWKISAISGYTTSGVYVPDDFSSLPAYDKDDYFYFHDNLKYEQNAGPLLDPDHPSQIIDAGSWQLTTSDQFITLVSDTTGVTYNPLKIITLTKTNFSFEEELPFSGNKVTYSFIAQ